MKEIQPPELYTKSNVSLFLAGSIEMGSAINWQQEVITSLQKIDCTILNPRRNTWNSSWVQVASNPIFNEQVTWELDGIEKHADVVCFYFDPNTKSPITLLELGLALGSGKECIVCCPEGYWRKGNVDITCSRFGVEVINTKEAFIEAIQKRILN